MSLINELSSILTGGAHWYVAADRISGQSRPRTGGGARSTGASPAELSEEDRRKVEKLKKRDSEVKAHEQAHMSAGGQYVRGGASYSYEEGPDGRRYAVGGEVSIDVSPVKDDPAATVRKMQQVQAAALAPAKPSGQDRAVAARAAQYAAAAMVELSAATAPSSAGPSSGLAGKEGSSDRPSMHAYTRRGTAGPAAPPAGMMLDLIA